MKKLWNTSMIYLILPWQAVFFTGNSANFMVTREENTGICSYPPSGAWHVPLSSDYPVCQPEAGTFR